MYTTTDHGDTGEPLKDLKLYKCINRKIDHLQHLDLSESNLLILDEELFNKLTNLKVINLSGNKLINLPISIGALNGLIELNVSKNNLPTLPDEYYKLNRLRVLDCSCNMLTKVPDCLLCGMAIISHLNLSNNLIESFSNTPFCISYLNVLNISNNKMITPHWIWSPSCFELSVLNVSCNKWYQLYADPKRLKSWHHTDSGICLQLNTLDVSNANLNSFSVSFLKILRNLKVLSLGNNNNQKDGYINTFCSIPSVLLEIAQNLVELYIPSIGLSSLPQEVNKFSNLKVLDVSKNRLCWLPDSFCKMKTLNICILSHNKLYWLPPNFGQLESLEDLRLDGNQIETLPASFEFLYNLKWLDLYCNQLEYIPSVLLKLKLIVGIDMSLNYIDFTSLESADGFIGQFINGYKQLENMLRTLMQYTNRKSGSLIRNTSSSSNCSDTDTDRYCSTDEESRNSSGICDFQEDSWKDDIDDIFDPTNVTYQLSRKATIYNNCGKRICKRCAFLLRRQNRFFLRPFRFTRQIKKIIKLSNINGQFDDANSCVNFST